MSEWNQRTLNSRCECHSCLAGITNQLHSTQSHDQSLYQHIPFNQHVIDITGGTTKCARTFIEYISNHIDQTNHDSINHIDHDIVDLTHGEHVIVEVGAGTGLVSIACSLLNNMVIATDQHPLLELLQSNVHTNINSNNNTAFNGSIDVRELLWNNSANIESLSHYISQHALSHKPPQYIIGSDLIYAKECIHDLVQTYHQLAMNTHSICYLVYISRFEWEKLFFDEMNEMGFTSVCVHTVDEIQIWKFTKPYS